LMVDFNSKVEWKVFEARTIDIFLDGELHVTANHRRTLARKAKLAVLHSESAIAFWAMAMAAAIGVWKAISTCQPLHRPLSAISRKRQCWRVLVHFRGGGKTKMMHCDPESTVGKMREELGASSDVVILLVPGRRELDNEMRMGEIVREHHLTVEVRCRGVGGGKEEDAAMNEAARAGNISEVRRLLGAGANIHATHHMGRQPLHMSSMYGHLEVSQLLLEAGANIDAADENGFTPLDMSVMKGWVELSQMLLGAGANLHAEKKSRQTVLHLAALWGHVDVCQVLVGAGANLNAANKYGDTPLHIAARTSGAEMVKLLLGAGANIHATNALVG